MKKNLIAAIVLMCVGLATFAGGKRDKNQNSIKQNDQYCYAGQTTCGTTYMTCSDIVLSAED
jgi:hypothetical protein